MPGIAEQKIHITAVVLAAGKGSRFNGHKMMHPINGVPMAIQCACNATPSVDKVIVIIRPNDNSLIEQLEKYGIDYIENPNFEMGMSSSIKQAVQSLEKNSHLMLCLGDMPYISNETYQTLVKVFKQHQAKQAVRPRFKGSKGHFLEGHPVIFPNHMYKQLMALSGDTGAKDLLRNTPPIYVETEDNGVFKDKDYN